MAFRDWEQTAASNVLVLPIRGKKYRIPPVGYLDAIRWREERALIADGKPPTMGNDEFVDLILGAALVKQMRADNVPEQAILHAATVAGIDHLSGRDAAEEMWEHGPSPEALAVALKMATTAQDGSTTSPDTPPKAPTSSTKKPANTASTRSRRKPPAPRSNGKKSSPTRRSSRPTSNPSTASPSTAPATASPGDGSPT